MSLLNRLLGTFSGSRGLRISDQLLFDKVIGFKGLVPGVGASTLLHNVAIAMSVKTSYTVCIVDTNYMFPIQYSLFGCKNEDKVKDILDFSGDVSVVVHQTALSDVYITSLVNRSVIDMLSTKDSSDLIDKLLGALKSYFDVVLVDLSHEPTNMSTYAAIKCNKIITVADPSLKCMIHMKKAYNHMSSLGVNFSKCNKVVMNKNIDGMVMGAESALVEAGLKVLGVAHLSNEIAILGVAGKQIWGAASKDKGVISFNAVVDSVVDDILQKTKLNEKYIDEKIDYSSLDKVKKEETKIVSSDDDLDVVIVESEKQ